MIFYFCSGQWDCSMAWRGSWIHAWTSRPRCGRTPPRGWLRPVLRNRWPVWSRPKSELEACLAADASRAGDLGKAGSRRELIMRGATYAIAGGLLWGLVRNLSAARIAAAWGRANLWILLAACGLSVSCWVIGEALLYSRLISYFHRRTSFREMLPINAAQEFLQIVNKAAAGTS